MRKLSNGFTILEILIVVIIISVLASLALPKFAMMVERARGTEGVAMLSMIRGAMERCYIGTRSYNKCIQGIGPGPVFNFNTLGISDPGTSPNSHFMVSGIGATVNEYIFAVSRNNNELLIPDTGAMIMVTCPNNGMGMGATGKSQIALCVSSTDVLFVGSGFYSGI